MSKVRATIFMLAAAGFLPVGIRGQATENPDSALAAFLAVDTSATRFLERVVRDRWLHEGQLPRFTSFDSVRSWTEIRTRTSGARPRRARNLDVELRRVKAMVGMAGSNAGQVVWVDPPPYSSPASYSEDARSDRRRQGLIGRGAKLNLPQALFWDLVVPRLPASLSAGVTWSDTLTYLADPGEGLLEELTGVRHHRVLGDTVLGAERVPVIQTEAEVRYRSRELTRDRGWVGPLVVEREMAGTVVGWMAVEGDTGIRLAGQDSTTWEGTATLIVQDGRSFPAPVRYERLRTWRMQDSTSWQLVQDSARTRRRANSFSMIGFPDSLRIRLTLGDSALADSLFDLVDAATDPEELTPLRWLLSGWRGPERYTRQELEEREEALHLQVGDTAGVFGSLVGPPWTEEKLDLLLPYLDDLGTYWRLGRLPVLSHQLMASQLHKSTAILQPDTSEWNCAPKVCERVLALLDSAREPRLRDVALSLAAARDPATYEDSLVNRLEAGSLVVQRTLDLIQGTVNGDEMPAPGASWREWAEWSGTARVVQERNRDALLLVQAGSKRNPIDELQALWPSENDSARIVVERLLKLVDAIPAATGDALADRILNGSAVEAREAAMEANRRSEESREEAPDSIQRKLLPVFLEWTVLGGPRPWPTLDPVSGNFLPAEEPMSPERRGHSDFDPYLLGDSLPDWALEPWEGEVRIVDYEAWLRKPPRQGGTLLTIGPVMQWGPFLRLTSSRTTHQDRGPDQGPRGFSSGWTFLLLQTENGWVVVAEGQWMT